MKESSTWIQEIPSKNSPNSKDSEYLRLGKRHDSKLSKTSIGLVGSEDLVVRDLISFSLIPSK